MEPQYDGRTGLDVTGALSEHSQTQASKDSNGLPFEGLGDRVQIRLFCVFCPNYILMFRKIRERTNLTFF